MLHQTTSLVLYCWTFRTYTHIISNHTQAKIIEESKSKDIFISMHNAK